MKRLRLVLVLIALALLALIVIVIAIPENGSEVGQMEEEAEQGDADVQFKLASSYQKGDGVRQDFEKAAKWYREAAK